MYRRSRCVCRPECAGPLRASRPPSTSPARACGRWPRTLLPRRCCTRRRSLPRLAPGLRCRRRNPSSGPSDCHLVDLDGRHPDAYRHALPFLAADAHAFIELQIAADHADVAQRLGAVADKRGVAHGASEMAVLDEIAFRGRENELAAGDIDLAAAEVGAVEALGNRADDVLG